MAVQRNRTHLRRSNLEVINKEKNVTYPVATLARVVLYYGPSTTNKDNNKQGKMIKMACKFYESGFRENEDSLENKTIIVRIAQLGKERDEEK